VGEHHAAFEAPRADADERHAVAVGAVHTRLHLEHQPGERRVQRARVGVGVLAGLGAGARSTSASSKPPHAHTLQGRPEEHRRRDAREEVLLVEPGADLLQQGDLLMGG
jgi:hypothetical protein